MPSDLERILEFDRNDIAASKAQDFDALIGQWDPDGVALPPGGEAIVGIDALKEWLSDAAEPSYRITEYVHDFRKREILGDWAFEWGGYASAAEPLAGGEPARQSGHLLRILKRQVDGSWKAAVAIWNVDPSGTSPAEADSR